MMMIIGKFEQEKKKLFKDLTQPVAECHCWLVMLESLGVDVSI